MQSMAKAAALFRQGQHVAARDVCEGILERDPRSVPALNLLGAVCAVQGDRTRARNSLTRALQLDPRQAATHYMLGNLQRESGQLDEAAASYRRALQLRPAFPEALINLGLALFDQRELDAAIASYRRALALRPEDALALYNLGNALQAQGELEAAVASYDRALAAQPQFADAQFNRGNALQLLGRTSEAIESFRDAIAVRPDCAAAYVNLGRALKQSGRLVEAVSVYSRALLINPGSAVAHHNLANAQRESGDLSAALASCERALVLDPDYAEAHLARALALHEMWRVDEAMDSYRASLRLKPTVEGYNNAGTLLAMSGSLEEAANCYEQALALQPWRPDCQHNLGLLRLTQGDFERGWPAFEARLQLERTGKLKVMPDAHRWDGDLAVREPLVIVCEQGFGDDMQFVRYGKLFNDAGIRPILQTDRRMGRLLSSCPYFADVMLHSQGEALGRYAWCPLLSLPLHFGTRLHDVPAPVPYLRAEADRVGRWRARLIGADRSLQIGIAWQGNPAAEVMGLRGRSVPLSAFAPLAQLPGVRLISLQRGAGSEQLRTAEFRNAVVDPGEEFDAGPDAFLDSAALMHSLDLVITSDTAVAHLAGALGVRTWVALHGSADWRWLRERSDSPWYPTMRLFRQPALGDWSPVFAAMAQELAQLAALVASDDRPQSSTDRA